MPGEEVKRDIDSVVLAMLERQAEQRATLTMFQAETDRRIKCQEARTEKILDEIRALEGNFATAMSDMKVEILSEIRPIAAQWQQSERALAVMAAKVSGIIAGIVLVGQLAVRWLGKLL